MENEILENGTAPETEVVQETETVVTEPAEAVTEPAAPEKKGNKITEALGKAADKGKELAENPKYKIEDKEKLGKDELKDIQKEIRSAGKSYYNAYSDLDSDDYESIAESLDITKAQAKKLASLYKSIGKTLKTAKVTKGYKLTVTRTLTGSELDEPIETELEIYVYKVNGRWISDDAF